MLIGLNKPFDVVCQFRAGPGVHDLSEYISQVDVYPAGRLDKDSEGLVLLTDDGKLQTRISDPFYKLPKTYWVQVEGIPDTQAMDALRQGIILKDGLTAPAEAEPITEPAIWPRQPPIRYRASIPTTWLRLILREGRNRQVRRMTAAIGYPTLRLIRYAIGPWTLDGLEPGQWREFDQAWPTLQKYSDSHDIYSSSDRRRRHRTSRQVSDGRRRRRRTNRS